MVSISTIITVIITFCISTILPLAVLVVYALKNKGKGIWSAWFLGAAGFFAMQIVIRTPILNLLGTTQGFMTFATEHFVLYCLIMAFTAALFEVIGRYAVAKFMSKNLIFERGIAAGLGHGGIEAIVIIGLTYLNNLIYIGMINSGTFDGVVEQTVALGVDTTSLLAIKDNLLHMNSAMFLLAGYERILTMILQVALSLVICYFVSHKEDWKGIVICLICHCLVDFTAPFVNGCATQYMGNLISTTTAYTIVYVFLTMVAVLSIFTIRKMNKKW